MKSAFDSQVQFFNSLKAAIPSYCSLVDAVAETIDVSIDSAYRRIRGEKLLNYQEMFMLCQKYNISVDRLFSLNSNTIVFQSNQNKFEKDNFHKWMEDVYAQLQMVQSFNKKHIYFLLKDMPPWYHYYHKELALFKFFFWKKSILYSDSINGKHFSLQDECEPDLEELQNKILKVYNKIDTTEIWNEEGINTTLRQIHLYQDMGLIPDPQDTIKLYNCLLEVVDHLENMAEVGKKFPFGGTPNEGSPDYNFFVNEFVLGDNTFFVELDDIKITYLNYNVIYFMGTSDQTFNEGMFQNLKNLIKKSTQISKVGEKERRQFFNKLRKKISIQIDSFQSTIE
ncbi:hypothetical protein [Algoriphagus machipongonensis]|uniref:Transcription regulator BetR N-terminal domain-containing protein n=1 Tax=Algoriphagus machipongonensis TaxID=388413 RepID=A3HS90_9BACT|nr:hypothetical protein [Algoriphagus machipongonensis]EAZ82708.1 hypothetical protein ALPR1_10845 [Algoriphagus machipongonensis]